MEADPVFEDPERLSSRGSLSLVPQLTKIDSRSHLSNLMPPNVWLAGALQFVTPFLDTAFLDEVFLGEPFSGTT